MKRNISWQVLILIGLVGAFAGYFIGGVVGNAIGVIGDICFLIGVANMIVVLVKNIKAKKEQKQNIDLKRFFIKYVPFVVIVVLVIVIIFLMNNSVKTTENKKGAMPINEESLDIANKYGIEVLQVGGQGSKTYKATAYLLNKQKYLEPVMDWTNINFNRAVDIMDVKCRDGYVMYSCIVNGIESQVDDVLGCRNLLGVQNNSVNINCIKK